MIYFARVRGGELRLAHGEHHDIRWVDEAGLDLLDPPLSAAIKWYCVQALTEVTGAARSGNGHEPVFAA